MLACGAWVLVEFRNGFHANPRALLGPQPVEELVHAGLGAILAPKPDRPPAFQIAHHDPVRVALLDRDLIDADHLGTRCTLPAQLLPHVLLLQLLDRFPVEMKLLGDVPDGRCSTPPADEERKALGVERIVREPVERLTLHLAAAPTRHPPQLHLQVHTLVAARQIANAPDPLVVVAPVPSATDTACRFFRRRVSETSSAMRSPKTPWTSAPGTTPGNRYASRNSRRRTALGIRAS